MLENTWQKNLRSLIGVERKLSLVFADSKLLQDYVPVELNNQILFLPLNASFSNMLCGETIYFSIHGFYSLNTDTEDWMKSHNVHTSFQKTCSDSLLPVFSPDTVDSVYFASANILRKIYTSCSYDEAVFLIFDCRGFKECLSPDEFAQINLLFTNMYSRVNTIIFLTDKDNPVPCSDTKVISAGFPEYTVRKAFLTEHRFHNAPVISCSIEQFALHSSGFSLNELESLTHLSAQTHSADINKLISLYTCKETSSPFHTYEKTLVEQNLRKELEKIKGNTDVKTKILMDILSLFSGMDCSSKKSCRKIPLVYFLSGSPGIGKSELARSVGAAFGQNNVITISMSEFSSSSSINDLLGSSRGYVGYTDRSVFDHLAEISNDINIVIFDEIEKADPAVIKTLLRPLNDGYMELRNGTHVSFCNSIIFFTSNLGINRPKLDKNGNPVWDAYGKPVCEPAFNLDSSKDIINKAILDGIQNHFRNIGTPEFLNRIGQANLLPMQPLSEEDIIALVKDRCEEMVNLVQEQYHCKIQFSDMAKTALNCLANLKRLDGESGRGIARMTDNFFRTLHEFEPTSSLIIDYKMEDSFFTFTDPKNHILKKRSIYDV